MHSEPHIVSEPDNSLQAQVAWLWESNFSTHSAYIQCQRGTVSYEAYSRYAALDRIRSESIGGLALICADIHREIPKLQEAANTHEKNYTRAVEALWATEDPIHREVFRDIAKAEYHRAHTLQVEAHRLKQREKRCLEGIDRLNSAPSPLDA
jgi:hypothetical protein